jgi:uncharacterized protein YqjF (DUF2071 family)
MNVAVASTALSATARLRMLAVRGEPLFLARWDRAVFIHYEAEPSALQNCVPFHLDLHEGRAFVSLVAFTLQRMRPRRGGRIGEWLLKPIGTHEFLNVRTYVQHDGEPGIYFLAEWLSNAVSVPLGPPFFGLPYRYGRLDYSHSDLHAGLHGCVNANGGRIGYRARFRVDELAQSEAGSLDEFLLERYTAFTQVRQKRRLFRVWHAPWLQSGIDLDITADDLLATTGEWWKTARYLSANYSPGVEVWMGRPHRA